jgi:hypothetical protein
MELTETNRSFYTIYSLVLDGIGASPGSMKRTVLQEERPGTAGKERMNGKSHFLCNSEF